MILIVWLGLILFTFVYFYFCEWKLFPKRNRLKEMADLGFRVGECIESCPSRANKKRVSKCIFKELVHLVRKKFQN